MSTDDTNAARRGSESNDLLGADDADVLFADFPRADPAALAAFDPSTKLCTMNCGPHRDDPRTRAERKLLCGDCVEDWNR